MGVVIRLSAPSPYAFLDFALFFPDEGRWDNNDGRNYQVVLVKPRPPAIAPLKGLHAVQIVTPKPQPSVAALLALIGTEGATFNSIFDLKDKASWP